MADENVFWGIEQPNSVSSLGNRKGCGY